MAFLLPSEEIVYYHYQLQQDRVHDAQRATITMGVTADSAVMPTVIVASSCAKILYFNNLCMIKLIVMFLIFISCCHHSFLHYN